MDKLKEWIWKNIGWYIRELYRNVRNVIRWMPIIWKDRDWDDWYIYNILQTKLKHQAEYIGREDRYTAAQYDVQRMMTCVRLIEKIKEESYADEYMEYHDLDFGSTPIPETDLYELDITTKWENYDEYFLAYPLDYKRAIKGLGWLDINEAGLPEARRRERIASNMSHNRQKRAKQLLFKLLEFHIESWWD